MNKKGFTLVELLAVIAILAILVIIALPNILKTFSSAKKETFLNEIGQIIRVVKQDYLLNGGNSETYTNVGESAKKLSLTNDSNLKYYVQTDNSGKIIKLQVTNGEYQYDVSDSNGINVVDRNDVKEINMLDEDDILVIGFPITDISLFDYTIANGEVTINGVKAIEVVDSEKCINWLTENHKSIGCGASNNYICNNSLLSTSCSSQLQYLVMDAVPVESYEQAGIKSNHVSKKLSIPETIENLPVTKIQSSAFAGSYFTSIDIPGSIRAIDNNAFIWGKIETLILHEGLISIGSHAFKHNSIKSLTLPDSVTTIKNNAFENNNISSLTLSNNLATIDSDVFKNNKLTSIEIPSSVTLIKGGAFNNNYLPDNQSFIYARTTSGINNAGIVSYGGINKNVTIPDGVQWIGSNAFRDCQLNSVIIPSGVTSLGESSFYNNNLESVVIPSTVTSMGAGAFSNNKLSSVTMLNNPSYISDYLFNGNKLTTIVIPERVETIGISAFDDNLLTSITLPSGVKTINKFAFMKNKLTSLIIPSSVNTIQDNAFDYNQLSSVTIQGKSSSSDFTTLGSNRVWGWASNVTCVKNNTSNVENGCIVWEGSN